MKKNIIVNIISIGFGGQKKKKRNFNKEINGSMINVVFYLILGQEKILVSEILLLFEKKLMYNKILR